ncbi:MAG: GIY-YIG nuclease family protein [Patescibacteria group bacterium]
MSHLISIIPKNLHFEAIVCYNIGYTAGPARNGALRLHSAAGGSSKGMFYTYVLKSKKDNELYIGWTDDLVSRINEHNLGNVSSTRLRIPFALVYYEACLKKSAAINREKQLKTGFGRAYLNRRLK